MYTSKKDVTREKGEIGWAVRPVETIDWSLAILILKKEAALRLVWKRKSSSFFISYGFLIRNFICRLQI